MKEVPTTRSEPNGFCRCDGEVESQVADVAGPSRRYRSYGQMNLFGLRSDSTAGLRMTRREAVVTWLFRKFARVASGFTVKRCHTFPNQTLEHNAIALHFLLSDAAHGVAHL